MATVAERIRKALEIRGMKQIDLVERTGIGKSSISTYLSGDYEPKQKNLYKIAKVLDVSEAWLLGEDVPMERIGYFPTKEEMEKADLAFKIVDLCALSDVRGGPGDFQHLQVKDNKFYSLHVYSSDNREQLMQADSMLNYFHSIVKDHPEYIPLLHKVMYIFSTDSQAEMKIIEKLFADYNDHYEEMLEAAAKI